MGVFLCYGVMFQVIDFLNDIQRLAMISNKKRWPPNRIRRPTLYPTELIAPIELTEW